MFLVAGLGNPGEKYADTPHNMGFMVVDRLAEMHGIRVTRHDSQALTGVGQIAGRDVTLARDEALAQGVTINGLVILSETPLAWNPDHTNPQGGLDNYYRSHVVGGTGAFVIVAENFASFGQAIIKKLIAEIASSGPAQVRHASVR